MRPRITSKSVKPVADGDRIVCTCGGEMRAMIGWRLSNERSWLWWYCTTCGDATRGLPLP